MTDWIEHTGDTCPVDPETVVAVRVSPMGGDYLVRAGSIYWDKRHWSHYRVITPAKPPEPEMAKTAQEHAAAMFATAIKPEPDLITLRLECMKLAMDLAEKTTARISHTDDLKKLADVLLHYVLNGSETARD